MCTPPGDARSPWSSRGGKDAHGFDPFWKNYSGELPEEKPNGKKEWIDSLGDPVTTFGRHTAQEKSAVFMNRFILDPTIDVTPGTNPIKARIHEESKAPEIIFPFPDHLLRAELLLISSHGWLGGYMRGNNMDEMLNANPEAARKTRGTIAKYFSIGQASAEGKGFRGPLWIVLAQCSTANSATWELWTEVFAKSKPIVRGILAYEEASPGPSGSITISKKFFDALQQKRTILDAWKQANSNQKWAAIVHKDAMNDRIQDWRSFKPIADDDNQRGLWFLLGVSPVDSQKRGDPEEAAAVCGPTPRSQRQAGHHRADHRSPKTSTRRSLSFMRRSSTSWGSSGLAGRS